MRAPDAGAKIRDGGDPRQGSLCRLGDSMSIDDDAGGPGRGAASLLWRNRDHDFPTWAGRNLTTCDPTVRLALLAGDGASCAWVAGE
jgi:hypothetical protein